MEIKRRDLILVLCVAVMWGIHAPIIRLGVLEIGPFLLATIRFGLTALVFLPFANKPEKHEWRILFFVGLYFLVGNLGFAYLALDRVTANSFVVITQIGQPMTLILAWLLFKESFGIWTVLGIITSFTGIVFVFGAPDLSGNYIGIFFSICAAFFWSLGSVWMKHTGKVKPLTMLAYSNLMMFPVMLSLTILFEHGHMQTLENARLPVVTFVVSYQVLMMGLMMMVWAGLMNRNPAQLIAPFLMLQPLFAVVASYFLLGEILQPEVFWGGFIVLTGIGIINWRQIVRYKK